MFLNEIRCHEMLKFSLVESLSTNEMREENEEMFFFLVLERRLTVLYTVNRNRNKIL